VYMYMYIRIFIIRVDCLDCTCAQWCLNGEKCFGMSLRGCLAASQGLPQRKSPDCVSPEFLLIVEQLLAQMLGSKK